MTFMLTTNFVRVWNKIIRDCSDYDDVFFYFFNYFSLLSNKYLKIKAIIDFTIWMMVLCNSFHRFLFIISIFKLNSDTKAYQNVFFYHSKSLKLCILCGLGRIELAVFILFAFNYFCSNNLSISLSLARSISLSHTHVRAFVGNWFKHWIGIEVM